MIRVENLTKIYYMGEVEVVALRGVSFKVSSGDFLAIMGPSGSGKSTLMNIIGCLDKPTSGNYLLEGTEVSKLDKRQLAYVRNKKIGFVFQMFNLLPRTTALENVELPLLYSNITARNRRRLAEESLTLVGLSGRETHYTSQLSGGEQQRAAIARALVNSPSIILADEPTGNVDSQSGAEIMEIFKSLNQEKKITILLVTHDLEISRSAKRMILFRDGEIIKEQIINN
ncbi:MAG: ABC transporter ATP-binding protein [Candidatus Aminicenantes bacterium]|nr:ABC transporter ATP-binding protein [Candidatus Aminicenantes bacterium]MDH5715176.1 ABC transporter ATP-binding protein [Candidatus Aminicenantes bacterium]